MADKNQSAESAEKTIPSPDEGKTEIPEEFKGLNGSELIMALMAKIGNLESRVGDGKSEREVEAVAKAQRDAKRKEAEAKLEEYVEVMVTKIPVPGYKEPVYLSINGENCRFERGVRVKIKRKFANLLDQSQVQDAQTIAMMEREERRFATDPNTIA
ncbi:MAG: hypothetical protein ACI3YH_03175 [Eubacteriales bacterium]